MIRQRARRGAGSVMLSLALLVCAGGVTTAQAQAERSRGEYVAILGDCIACHSVPGGEPFAGGLTLPTPLGDIVATNITPSDVGIGDYTLEQFDAAVRRGVRADGKRLYPAMPYTAYARVSDEDIAAMYEWFMNDVQPSDHQPPATELPFPFNMRFSLAVWNLLFHDNQTFSVDPSQTDQWNRGAYLVQGLTHCGTCHTPRNLMMAEDASRYLAGGAVGPWEAPDITSNPRTGIGEWSVEELVQYMQTGNTARSQAAGPMAEVVDHSLRHATDEDLEAIAVYLQTVPAARGFELAKGVHEWGEAGNSLAAVRGEKLAENVDEWTGPQLYDAYCAACHQASGQGTQDGVIPALFHNTATGREQTNNLALVILHGIHWVGEGHEMRMPGFAHELTDKQITTVSNYVIEMYGNPDTRVSIEQVQALRDGTAQAAAQPDLVRPVRIGAAMLFVVLLFMVWRLLRRKLIRT